MFFAHRMPEHDAPGVLILSKVKRVTKIEQFV